MNHCISLSCSSFDRVDGLNSLSTHCFAAASSAKAGPVPNANSTATAGTIFLSDIALTSLVACGLIPEPAGAHERPARPRLTLDRRGRARIGLIEDRHHLAPTRRWVGKLPNQASSAAVVAGARCRPSFERRHSTSVAA